MWRSDSSERLAAPTIDSRQLPLYIEPAPEEALLSWLLRLAARLEVSMEVLLGDAFGIKHRGGRLHWWRRPHAWTLKRISDRTGVGIDRLRRMTLTHWASYRDDETSERFSERVLTRPVPDWRVFHYVVCHECLKPDSAAYIRLSWTIGWLAICPHHRLILITRCEHCRAKLRVPAFRRVSPFSPLKCPSCDDGVWFADYKADSRVLGLQQALLRGKETGAAELDGLGTFTWPEVVGLADALLRTFWRGTTEGDRQRLYAQFREDFSFRWIEPPARYADLALLTWLTSGWPNCPGATVGRDMLRSWISLQRDRRLNEFERRVDVADAQASYALELRVRELC